MSSGQERAVAGEPHLRLDFQHMLDALADPVVAASADNRIVYVNHAAEALLGWPAGELIAAPLTTIMPERFRDIHTAAFERFVATREPKIIGHPIRVPALSRHGDEIDIELSLAAFPLADGGSLVVASLRDLRERVELERQLTVTRYLRASVAAAANLSSRLDPGQVLTTVVNTLVTDFDAALARIWLYEPATNMLHLRASAGLSTRTEESPRAHIDIATYPYKIGEVARSRRPFVQNGLRGDPAFDQDWVEREGIASVAVFPLVSAGELHGVLAYFSRQQLPEEVVEALATFIAIVTAALNDVELFRREQEARLEAEEAESRFAFLAEASRILSSSLDYQTTLTNLAHLVVPRLADWCIVDVVAEDGTVDRVATAHADPAKLEFARAFQERYPADRTSRQGLMKVLRTGRPEIVAEISDEMLAPWARDAEHLRLLRELAPRSVMRVPLLLYGRTLGAITFLSTESGRHYDKDDMELAEDLARRAALAVDNARLYSELQQALRSRDEFLSSISHDLRNPLTAIRGKAQVLQRRVERLGGDTEAIDRGLQSIVDTADRMNRMINDLVDVANLRMGRPLALHREETDLVALARQVSAEFQQTTDHHTIRLESAVPQLIGHWDATRLERVLANLLSNAIKYSPDGGEIVVGVRPLGEGAAELTVRDQGVGIPLEDLQRVFERFHRGANVAGRIAGTGIGLAGAKQIVEQHGGSIVARSREGRGATFTVVLPLQE